MAMGRMMAGITADLIKNSIGRGRPVDPELIVLPDVFAPHQPLFEAPESHNPY